MVVIEQIISELLLRHNCVIVPSFGGFVARKTSASIDYQTGVMHPPKKSILFNRQLINNDGLLIAEYAVKNRVQYTEAQQAIQGVVHQWQSQLDRGERVTIDKVGFLFYDTEKNLCFEQDRFFNLLLESYGLGKVHFLTMEDVELTQRNIIASELNESESRVVPIVFDQEATATPNPEPVVIEHPAIAKSSNAWKYIAAACVLPFAFYSYWIPAQTNVLESGMISVHDFNPLHHTTAPKYTKAPAINPIDFPENENFEDQLEVDADGRGVYRYDEQLVLNLAQSKRATAVQSTAIDYTTSSSQSFEWIVGCFSRVENAQELIQQLKQKGIQAYTFDVNNGLTRVSAGGARSQAEIQRIANQVKALGYDGWTLKK